MTGAADGRLWHGGVAGLAVGDTLLPPETTGNARQTANRDHLTARFPNMDASLVTPDDASPGWVHFTPLRQVALAYAGSASWDFGAGALYVVEPVGAVEVDPDMPVTSLRARSARIVTVYDPLVTMTERRAARLHAQAVAMERGSSYREAWEGMQRHCERIKRGARGSIVMIRPDD